MNNIEKAYEKRDCQTCKSYKRGMTMLDCFGKHHFSFDYGCSFYERAETLNYTDEEIEKKKVLDPTACANLCDNADDDFIY